MSLAVRDVVHALRGLSRTLAAQVADASDGCMGRFFYVGLSVLITEEDFYTLTIDYMTKVSLPARRESACEWKWGFM